MNNPLKIYKANGNRILEYRFETLNSFLNYIETTPTSENHEKHFGSELSSETGTFSFTKTQSLKEANELCRNGCDENFDKFIKLKNEVSKKIVKPSESTVIYKDVVGYAPSVADFLAGSPFNMWNKVQKPFNNVVDIYFQLAYNAYTTTSQIYNRGAITLSLIDALEKFGYAVNLHAFDLSYEIDSDTGKQEILLAFFKLKDCSNYLNEKIAFFPFCHPSFLRRCIFRLTEVSPLQAYWYAYGKAVSSIDTMKKYIHMDENSIIISTPNALNISGDNIYEDLSSMLKKLDLQRFFIRI